MFNIGIIGITEVLEPYVKRIQKNRNVNVIGKASVGTSAQLNSFHFSIPEFNRVELIERADILLIDNSSLLPFDLLCDMVKKGKHIFATEYLSISADECLQLVKLANESGSVIQFSNPYFYLPGILWIKDHFHPPLYLDIAKFEESKNTENILYPILLMLAGITGLNPKKIGVTAFESDEINKSYTNIRLEFVNASVVNLNYGSLMQNDKFKIKGYSNVKFATLNLEKNNCVCNGKQIDVSSYLSVKEFDTFVQSIREKTREYSNIEDYFSAIQLVGTITQKIAQFLT